MDRLGGPNVRGIHDRCGSVLELTSVHRSLTVQAIVVEGVRAKEGLRVGFEERVADSLGVVNDAGLLHYLHIRNGIMCRDRSGEVWRRGAVLLL